MSPLTIAFCDVHQAAREFAEAHRIMKIVRCRPYFIYQYDLARTRAQLMMACAACRVFTRETNSGGVMTERSKHNAERLMQEHKAEAEWKPLNRLDGGTPWIEKVVLWAVIVCVTIEVIWQLHLYLQRH